MAVKCLEKLQRDPNFNFTKFNLRFCLIEHLRETSGRADSPNYEKRKELNKVVDEIIIQEKPKYEEECPIDLEKLNLVLTPKQLQIYYLIKKGYSLVEIKELLNIKMHRLRIEQKKIIDSLRLIATNWEVILRGFVL